MAAQKALEENNEMNINIRLIDGAKNTLTVFPLKKNL